MNENASYANRTGCFKTDKRTGMETPCLAIGADAAKPLDLPAVHPDTARLSQLVCDARIVRRAAALGVRFTCIDPNVEEESIGPKPKDPALLIISFVNPRETDKRAQLSVTIDLEQHFELLLAVGASTRCVDTQRVEVHARSAAHQVLADAIAKLLLEPLLMRLRDFGFADARLEHIRRIAQVQQYSAPTLRLLVSVAQRDIGPDQQYLVGLSMSGDALGLAETMATGEPQQAFFTTLKIPGRLLIGTKPIALHSLQSLKAGDVLLRALSSSFSARLLSGDHSEATPHRAARAIAIWGASGYRNFVVAVAVTSDSLTILEEPHVSEEAPLASTNADVLAGSLGEPVAIEAFELPVQFEIDTVAMSIGQLSVLRAGYIIELPIPFADAHLRLVAHNQTIGYGELVTVGEHLGVRIVRMAHSRGCRQKDGDDSAE
jgi:type III secretion protein Q